VQFDLVISDMDGTLLRDDKSISPRTREAIRRYEAAGGHFSFASGRGVEASSRYFRAIDLNTPLVLLNGSLLYDPATDRDLACVSLDRPTVEAVWPILAECGLNVIVHGPRRGVTRELNPVIEEHLRLDGITLDLVADLGPHNAGTVMKILTIGQDDQLNQAEAAILRQQIPVHLVRSYHEYLEVLPPVGGKGAGLSALLRHLGIPRERALAVGDYLNDLDLLQAAGMGVAMANAHPGLKQVAHRWTASNMADGVAELLEALVEGREVGTAPLLAQ
jgi:Cof subfamily protein (haloacid dehalogenase superfamily)